MTGYTRDGKCADIPGDMGSHHICIDLSSTKGGNFCTVTGQPDWCSENSTCDGNPEEECPIEHWCVCQWAFARYIQKAGGCNNIQTIECEAINVEAIKAYEMYQEEDIEIKNALNCINERCIK
eukprot:CAMPEP_0194368596 /NCGR_PEP_ID=MMETSP0174-20130528/16795_1 /TAXON_ID=216777 /ORGANISM="Proboscia alata, Strain PI-D3" /LENGTH=122 /DNA_ID=CAMNT_0039145009 /DNA_START=285 /DNA_END=653 /DNA_ORIENTATION=+